MKTTAVPVLSSSEESDLIVRLFGWNILTFIVGLLFNNILTVACNFPGALSVFSELSIKNIAQVCVYLISILVAVYISFYRRKRTLRKDAELIHQINLFLIRGFFWSVFCRFWSKLVKYCLPRPWEGFKTLN